MREAGYNQLMRILKFYNAEVDHRINNYDMDIILRNLQHKEVLVDKTLYISNYEYSVIQFRFGIDDGQVKTIKDGAYKFNKTIEQYTEMEKAIILKIVKYVKIYNKKLVV